MTSGWDHPSPQSAHPASLSITPTTEVTIMPRPVTEDGRGWKIFIQRGELPLESRIVFGNGIEEVKNYISAHPQYFA